jgi:iron complex outermembrane receptor protein
MDSTVPTDFLGRSRPGGIQVFPGFRPENELNEFRNSIAGYFDVEADVSETFLLAGAVRYENYSDFGGTFNGKLATRIKAGDNINFRAAVQTGFRAPSLHQIHFNSTSTLFVDGIPFEVGVFPNTSRIARILGIEQLQDETSFGVSLGFTANIPDANLKVTIDGYLTTIDDRVIETGQFTDNDNAELAVLFAQANAERVGFFANAVDTKTTGLDIVIDHKASLSDKLNLKNTLAFTFSDTEIEGVNIPDAISAAGLGETFFDQTSRIYIESAVPRVKGNLLHNLRIGEKWNIFLRNAYFGEVTEATNNASPATYGGKIVTDLSFGYQMGENTRVTFGANNLLDVYSDQVPEDFRSSGRFIYSRRSQQFGTNGRHLFARLNFTIN